MVTRLRKYSALLLLAVFALSSLITVQAYSVDSITKPSAPEFTVRIVSYPYDVPSKTTTTIDQYTGKETTTTQPGYHVENKSLEIVIKNPQFTPIIITEYTPVSHYWYENYVPTPIECNYTANLYYNTQVKGRFGDDWTSVGGTSSYPPQSNAQLDSKYTIISIKADYPNEAVLDFRVQTLIGYYVPYGRNVVIFGYDFYGQESDWSNIQTLNLSETSASVSPSPTVPSTLPSQDSTTNPQQNPSSGESDAQAAATLLSFNWTEIVIFSVVGVVIALLITAVVLLRRRVKTLERKNET